VDPGRGLTPLNTMSGETLEHTPKYLRTPRYIWRSLHMSQVFRRREADEPLRYHEESGGALASPELWIPVFRAAYRAVSELAFGHGVSVAVAGSAAYSVHVELDETKDIDLVLSRPLEVGVLAAMLPRLEAALRGEGFRIVGGRLQLGRTPEDWAGQLIVAPAQGRVVGVEVFNLLACRPLSLYEVVDAELAGTPIKAVSLESWFASKLADPGGLGIRDIARLEKAVEKGVDIDKLISIVQRLSMGETIKINARDALRRTRHQGLRAVLSILA